MPLLPALPDSMTQYHGFRPELPRTYMEQGDGANCPLYEENNGKPIAEDK